MELFIVLTQVVDSWSYTNVCMLSSSVVPNSLWPHGLYLIRLLCPWNFPVKNTGVGCHFLLQGISLTQELNPCLLFPALAGGFFLFLFFLHHCATWEACMILHKWQNCMELTHTHTHTHTQLRIRKTEEVRIRWVNYININVLALILCYSFEKQNVYYPWGKLEKCTKYFSVLFLQMHVILQLSTKFN